MTHLGRPRESPSIGWTTSRDIEDGQQRLDIAELQSNAAGPGQRRWQRLRGRRRHHRGRQLHIAHPALPGLQRRYWYDPSLATDEGLKLWEELVKVSGVDRSDSRDWSGTGKKPVDLKSVKICIKYESNLVYFLPKLVQFESQLCIVKIFEPVSFFESPFQRRYAGCTSCSAWRAPSSGTAASRPSCSSRDSSSPPSSST